MSGRIDHLRRTLAEANADCLVCASLPNLRYLTGFTGSNGAVIVTAEDAVFLTDGRYRLQASREVKDCAVEILSDVKLFQGVANALADLKTSPARVAVEGDALSVNQFESFRGMVHGREVVAVSGWVEALRLIKSSDEVAAMRRAVETAEAAFLEVLPTLKAGDTEAEVRRRLRDRMEERGAEKESFDTIVLFGPRTALPHGRPGATRLQVGDWVLIDFGCVVDGYCSDITRTFVFGHATPQMKRAFEVVAEANQRAITAARAGMRGAEVDAAARQYISSGGYGDRFEHGLGHGVGIEIHEAPRLAATSEDTLAPGMAVTIEPGVYIPNWGGVRIEDLVIITDGEPEVLTSLPVEIEPLVD